MWQRRYQATRPAGARLPSEGIGLDIVRTILEAHGSSYGIRQEEGMTCFYFTLKIDQESERE